MISLKLEVRTPRALTPHYFSGVANDNWEEWEDFIKSIESLWDKMQSPEGMMGVRYYLDEARKPPQYPIENEII